MAKQQFADVLVEVSGVRPERTFQYRVPQKLEPVLQFGHRVRVPFGGRQVTGFVVGMSAQSAAAEIKEIISLEDEQVYFTKSQFALARWMADFYFCGLLKALQATIAPILKKTKFKKLSRFFYNQTGQDAGVLQGMASRAPKSLSVLEAARKNPGLTRGELALIAGVSPSVVDRLAARGLLRTETEIVSRDPYPLTVSLNHDRVSLTGEQKQAARTILSELQAGRHEVFLLHGVTGSGKTEVYLRCIEYALKIGRQAITLVPEISLTSQMVRLYKARFGPKVAVLHSRMSDGERYDEWMRINQGLAPVVLGARSAVLAPVPDPGIIIIDEEHEGAYKQEEAPRYHARAVALYLARRSKGVLVLGSATPSLESYCRALPGGVYKLIDMKKRIMDHGLPAVEVLDMREELQDGNSGIFSRRLLQKIEQRLHNNEQTLIFLNRRGFNTLVVCRECGLVLKCPHCDISLTFHNNGQVRCHYCNFRMAAPRVCPGCGGRQTGYFGTGTQRVEKELAQFFPKARILRADADTTTGKGSHQRILESFGNGAADILVGTQMIAKGLDMPGVTLVGVVNADVNLHMPDFRAGERTFQLLAQVAGRAGRGKEPGEVLIQTFTPEHYSVQAAARHDYPGFFQQEIKMRQKMGYPPFTKMVRLVLQGQDEQIVIQAAEDFRARLDRFASMGDGGKIFIVGPAPAPLSRIKDKFRWHIIAWSADYGRLHKAIKDLWQAMGTMVPRRELLWHIDVDPINIM